MLSVIIPTYNRNCYLLGKIIAQQCAAVEGLEWEVVVIDDGSADTVAKASNVWLKDIDGVRYVEMPNNVGRACIRNRAVDVSRGDWLVFLDDDVMPSDEHFIERYVRSARRGKYDVVCGGVNAVHNKEDESSLRWIYDAYAENRLTVERRRQNPYDCFTTQNFLARREVFMRLRFNENLKLYGYEDALFGIQLQTEGFSLRHINNPVVHLGIEPNEVFLRKSEMALVNLCHLGSPMTDRARVSVFKRRLQSRHLLWCVKLWHRLFGRLERALLCSKFPSVHVFQLYKLGYYSLLKDEKLS